MAEIQNLVLQWITMIVAVLLLFGSFTWFAAPVINVPTAKEIAAEIALPEAPETQNLTGVEDRLADIETTLNEDEEWEDEAEAIATEEWEDRDYKDLFRWMSNPNEGNLSIDDRDDIIYVKEDESTFFISADSDDKDANLEQFVKVKYEDMNGKNQRVYLTIETRIDEGEIENQEISIT